MSAAESAAAPAGSLLPALGAWLQGAPPSTGSMLLYILIAVGITVVLMRLRGRRSAPSVRAPGAALALRPHTDNLRELLSAFESETAAVFERTAPVREHIVLYVLTAMLIIACTLAAVVKLDRVVTGIGRVAPVGGELFVSPLDRAIIREVLVREGDVVKQGQALATLDPTFASADLAQLQQRLASSQAEAARREAEMALRPYQAGSDPYSQLQHGIWSQRQAEYRSTLEDFDARLKGARSAIAQYDRDVQDYEKRLKLAEQNEKMNVDLRVKGYVTQQAVIVSSDARLEVGRLLAKSQNEQVTTRHTVESVQAQRAAFMQKWQSDTAAALVTVRNDLDEVREELHKAEKLKELISLQAPADAVVLRIGKISQGSVAVASSDQEPLFTLVPLTATLEAEIRIGADDIGFIQPGDTVKLKLDAYSYVRHGTATGVIKTISEGSFTQDNASNATVAPHFRARVEIKELGLRNVPATFRLIPGMTLQADVMVGRRTLLSYLVEGVMRTGSEAMREPN